MNYRIYVYIFVTLLVLWAMDSLNINGIFKKNRKYQAQVMYFIIAICVIYLVTSFLFSLLEISAI